MFQTKANSYAFLSLLEVAERGEDGVKASEILSKYDLPPRYAVKVMGQLAKARICQSDRGRSGVCTATMQPRSRAE